MKNTLIFCYNHGAVSVVAVDTKSFFFFQDHRDHNMVNECSTEMNIYVCV